MERPSLNESPLAILILEPDGRWPADPESLSQPLQLLWAYQSAYLVSFPEFVLPRSSTGLHEGHCVWYFLAAFIVKVPCPHQGGFWGCRPAK